MVDGFSVREVLDTIEQVSGKRLSIVEAERRPGDPANLVADNRAIREVLNWAPQYDDLAIICRTAYNWECHSATKTGLSTRVNMTASETR